MTCWIKSKNNSAIVAFLLILAFSISGLCQITILCPQNPTFTEALAAKELCRYLYLRTATVCPIHTAVSYNPATGSVIIAGTKSNAGNILLF